MEYRYGHLPYRYGHPGCRYWTWHIDTGDDSIDTVILDIDVGYLVTPAQARVHATLSGKPSFIVLSDELRERDWPQSADHRALL